MAFTYDNFNSVLDDGDDFTIGQKITVGADAFVYNFSAGDTFTEALRLLNDPYNVVVKGVVGATDGYGINFDAPAGTSKLAVGATGEIFGGTASGISSAIRAGHVLNVSNSGKIIGFGTDSNGLSLEGNGNFKIMNNAGATIAGGTGSSDGIFMTGSGVHTIVNKGFIYTDGIFFSIEASDTVASVEKVTNYGGIVGEVYLGAGNDVLTIKGAGYVDGLILLGAGNDTVKGGAGFEHVQDGSGGDKVKLGAGMDTYAAVKPVSDVGGDGIDKVDGGTGIDLYDASTSGNNLRINLNSKAHTDTILGTANARSVTGAAGPGDTGLDSIKHFENAAGGNGGDLMYGSSAANRLEGNAGLDTLYGLAGNDLLIGGSDNDILEGGKGKDTLIGGPDNGSGDGAVDIFQFSALGDSTAGPAGRDVIVDFEDGTDQINLTVFGVDLSFLGVNTAFTAADQIRVMEITKGWLIQLDTATSGKVNFAIEVTDADHSITLDGGNFILAA